MSEVTICTHAQAAARLGDIVSPVLDLVNTAFADYEGALEMTPEFARWYMQRPGMSPDGCWVALDRTVAVSSVFVTEQTLLFRGEPVHCGIIDSVATLPAYQRQGLAHRLMERAHGAMRESGWDMAVLYTNPDNYPYQFYQRLGYKTRSWLDLMVGPRPHVDPETVVSTPTDLTAVRDFIAGAAARYDGVPQFTDEYWRWRKVQRPADCPARVLTSSQGDGIAAAATFASSDLTFGEQAVRVSVVSDLFVGDDAEAQAGLALLGGAPEQTLAALCDLADPTYRVYIHGGLGRHVCEVSMLLPFSEHGRRIADSEPAPWYPMVESVVGV